MKLTLLRLNGVSIMQLSAFLSAKILFLVTKNAYRIFPAI
ncbi:MAG: hypothetical protein ACI94Y_001497 [Maribacter sp.]|jgi:hypothetical protein